jgi:hypothetical protein
MAVTMSHHEFVDLVERTTAAARRVGLWPAGLILTDERPPRRHWWSRRHLDQSRLVVYVARQRRRPELVLADIRRAIVRHASRTLTPDQRFARAAALRRLTERETLC